MEYVSDSCKKIQGISSVGDFIDLAKNLGTIVNRVGCDVPERIYPLDKEDARPRSFGSVYGSGSYPLHTDTAHWHTPAQFVLLRVVGDFRRTTTTCDTKELLDSLTGAQVSALRSSVWYSNFGDARFTCSALFRHNGCQVFRFDPQCMMPANKAANFACEWLQESMKAISSSLNWRKGDAIILNNWNTLHGRGPKPDHEGIRELQRIYVQK